VKDGYMFCPDHWGLAESPIDVQPKNPDNGRFICTPKQPMPKGAKGRWEHTNAHEFGDGCFDGCCADYKCDDCGYTWREELPQ
jgi:hypothetical protein